MLVTLSPAKRLDWTVDTPAGVTRPRFQDEADKLAARARDLTVGDLQSLMKLSEDLARLNRTRFKDYAPGGDAAREKPAAFAFAGDTYTGLEAASLSEDALRWAEGRLRILSGLYGLLRPMDMIQPYRLEMGTRLKTERGKTLYDWWGTQISKALNQDAEEAGSHMLLNCASVEYFSAVDRSALAIPIITPSFLEEKNGTAKTVSFFAKAARGALARYVMEHRITDAEGLQGFDLGGYAYDPAASTPEAPVFRRPYPEPVAQKRSA